MWLGDWGCWAGASGSPRNGPSAERRGEATCVRRVFAADRACTPRESSSSTHGGDALSVPTHGLFASSNSLGGDGGKGGDGGGNGGDGGGDGGGACAQTSHPARVTLPSEDHVKALPSNTLLGPVVPSYVAPFTISLSKPLSVLKAVALKN